LALGLLGLLVGVTAVTLALDAERRRPEATAEDEAPTSTAGATGSAPATSTTTAPGDGEPITIAFAGDSYFEGTLRSRLDRDPATALGPFADTLRSADLAVINLETAIATGGTPEAKDFTFRAPPTAIDALRAAGVDVASMANNHGRDYGPAGLEESLAVKRAQADGMVIGIGQDEDDAFTPYRATVKGQRVAVVAATQVIDGSLLAAWTATPTHPGLASAKRVDRLVRAVADARVDSDTVVVFLHWGVERSTCPSGDQQALARRLVDAGADLVVGSHAHRLLGGGRLGDAVVHYGLGNFLFRANSGEGARTGVFEVTVAGRRIDGYRWIPGRIVDSVPRPLTGAEATTAAQAWDDLRGCTNLTA
jgi:poly-gamma-glutamate synthesis protein (capsule biosynthesis protein)